MKPMLKPPGTKHWKLNCGMLLSTFAFELNLCHYSVACCAGIQSFSDGGCVCSACDASCSAVVTMAKAGLHSRTLNPKA